MTDNARERKGVSWDIRAQKKGQRLGWVAAMR